MKTLITILVVSVVCFPLQSQEHSVARKWNEAVLEGIRNDFARPTVHARNLFHISAAMYDAWSVYDGNAEFYLLGKTLNGFTCAFDGIDIPDDIQAAQEEAMSYACYRIMQHRFADSPLAVETSIIIDNLMDELGYDKSFTRRNLEFGEPAALGNYIAKCYIDYGLQDGSNEEIGYENVFYSSVNSPLIPEDPGNPDISDPNRWQPLTLDTFIDQGGNVIPGATPDFLSAEWGQVLPFSLSDDDKTVYTRGGFDYVVYHDPGDPPYLTTDGSAFSSEYQWGFSLVPIWQSHLDPNDGVMWDISPGSSGNIGAIENYPTDWVEFRNFYNQNDGGDPGQGRAINPKTGSAYPENIVPRGDYGRVLAEFWADGPDSETPPGHWFTILNKVNDHPDLVKKFRGEGEVLSDLEWDVKAYFTLGGTMHDVAITAWGIKGWYDYVRPISAVRYMADQGQSSDPNASSYSVEGIPLVPGFIELVESGDPLAGMNNENVGKIKLFTWRGPDFIVDPEVDAAGVDWILAENWWPFQRPTFITPNFAGYVSGHSTYSRAAAEVLTLFTGDEYFPGGVGEFVAEQNEFLVFEEGPSQDITLQWATYRDASDQTSLSRIWGGIHPPADDIPGRLIGYEVGINAFKLAERYFLRQITSIPGAIRLSNISVFPNPATSAITIKSTRKIEAITIFNIQGGVVLDKMNVNEPTFHVDLGQFKAGSYIIEVNSSGEISRRKLIVN